MTDPGRPTSSRFTDSNGQDGSRCTVCGEKAGRHTAMYSAPSGPGVLYRIHSPRWVMTACPASTSITPSFVSTRSMPRRTIVYSSKCGICPGSTPAGGTLHTSDADLRRAGIYPTDEFIDHLRLIACRLNSGGLRNQPCHHVSFRYLTASHPGHDMRSDG
jgi:hypothetical protein